MVLANNEQKAARIKCLALHGLSADAWKRFSDEGYKHYYVVECGFKYNMMDLQAAIGLHQLKRIERYHQRRCQIWNTYRSVLQSFPITLPPLPEPDTVNAFHLYPILINENRAGINREQFLQRMTFHNIGVGVHYISLAEQPYYQQPYQQPYQQDPQYSPYDRVVTEEVYEYEVPVDTYERRK